MEGIGDGCSDFMQRFRSSGEDSSSSLSISKERKLNKPEPGSAQQLGNNQSCSLFMSNFPTFSAAKRPGIPPSHPSTFPSSSPPFLQSPYSLLPFPNSVPPSQNNSQPHRPSHSRSLSQPAFVSLDQSLPVPVLENQIFDRLPPVSPASSKRHGAAASPSLSDPCDRLCGTSLDVSMEITESSPGSNRLTLSPSSHRPPPISPFNTGVSGRDGHPGRKGHRRTHSEIPFRFSEGLGFQSGDLLEGIPRPLERDLLKEGVETAQVVQQDGSGDHNMEGMGERVREAEGDLCDDIFNVCFDMDKIDNQKSSGPGEIGEGGGESGRQTVQVAGGAVGGNRFETGAEKVLEMTNAECKDRIRNSHGTAEEFHLGDVWMRSADYPDAVQEQTDSGGSHVKEKSDKDQNSSGDEAESKVNEIRSQNGNTISPGLYKSGGSKQSVEGDTQQHFSGFQHKRSVSMECVLSNTHSFSSGEETKLAPSPKSQSNRHFRRNSLDGNINFKPEFGNGEFSGAELKKIIANEKLAEIAVTDPRRAKRILANRQSAARSKERKTLYILELENKVQTLQTEATTLSAQLTLLQRDSSGLTNENNGLKLRLQSMEQQAQLRDALNEALMGEVQRLKLATGQLATGQSTGLAPQISMNSQMFQLQQQGLHLTGHQFQQHQDQQQQRQQVKDVLQPPGNKTNQNETFQNTLGAFPGFVGSAKPDGSTICAGQGSNYSF